MFSITAELLRKCAPRCAAPEAWVDPLNDAMLSFGIAFDDDQVVEFLAQAAHESLQFTRLEECLTYTAERLMQVWPRRFPSLQAAVPYARAPHALADLVYSGRMGNGDVSSGDGWRYRGRGFGVTGKDNYREVARMLGDPLIVTCPDRLCQRDIAARSFAAWWTARPELARLADDLPDDDDDADFVSITRTVNGGTEGLDSRRKLRAAFSLAIRGR